MKKILVALCFLLGACASNPTPNIVISTKMVPIQIPTSLYSCPVLQKFPESSTLTDVQVAKVISTLYSNNLTCKSNIDSIKKIVDATNKAIK